jgi:Arc/MetJ-type ribon-helix-helix transcriptional regulator
VSKRPRKERLTVTVDPQLVRAANAAVKAGRVSSLSGWVNLALTERAAKDARLQAMAEAIAAYEAEVGEITAEEIEAQRREDRVGAIHPKRRRSA